MIWGRLINGLGGVVCVLVGAPGMLWIWLQWKHWPVWTAGLSLFGVLICGALIFFGLALVAQTFEDPETDDPSRLDVTVKTKPKQKKEQE